MYDLLRGSVLKWCYRMQTRMLLAQLVKHTVFFTFIHHKKAFIYKNLQCNYLVPVFLEHLLLSVHSEWITFSGNSPSAECFH